MRRVTSLIILSSFLISSCSSTRSLSAFEKMDSNKTAEVVCTNTREAKSMAASLTDRRQSSLQFGRSISEISAVLSRGYRIHRQCTTVYRQLEECTESYGKFTCRKVRDPSDWIGTQSCTESPVSIDPNYEERRLEELSLTKRELDDVISIEELKSAKYQTNCRSRAWSLTPNDAFQHYQNNTAP